MLEWLEALKNPAVIITVVVAGANFIFTREWFIQKMRERALPLAGQAGDRFEKVIDSIDHPWIRSWAVNAVLAAESAFAKYEQAGEKKLAHALALLESNAQRAGFKLEIPEEKIADLIGDTVGSFLHATATPGPG